MILALPTAVGAVAGKYLGTLSNFILMMAVLYAVVVVLGSFSTGRVELPELIAYFTSVGGMLIILANTLILFLIARLVSHKSPDAARRRK